MDIKQLSRPLTVNDIDFRIQSINKGGYATILAYKDARVDINRLNEVCGPLGWERRHSRENHNCTVCLWDAENRHWVCKEDTGTESQAEAEKGLASDSFKRACFNWGIGIELYEFPSIQVKLNGDGKNQKDEWYLWTNPKDKKDYAKQGWGLKLKEWRWLLESNEDGSVSCLMAKDQAGKLRFKYGERRKGEQETQ